MLNNSKNISLKWTSPHGRELPKFSRTPIVMGILNVSNDSFSDGGKYRSVDAALAQCEKMVSEGASIIDIGAESTRPNAKPISSKEEIDLLIPHLEILRSTFSKVPISVDTYKPDVARLAIESGADIINDVVSLCENNICHMAGLATKLDCPMIVTHNSRNDENVEGDFIESLRNSIKLKLDCVKNSGLVDSQIVLDMGIGFGKTCDENFEIVARISEFKNFGLPILLGVSRKSMFANIASGDMRLRDFSTAVVSAYSALVGDVQILRVHDVAANVVAINTMKEIFKWTKL